MITQDDLEGEVEEIANLIHYSVEERDRQQALSFLRRHKKEPIILTLLREFYSALPEGVEEPVIKVGYVRCKQGVCLLAVSTIEHKYLYFAAPDRATYMSRLGEVLDKPDILGFFDYEDGEQLAGECLALQEEDAEAGVGHDHGVGGCPVCFTEPGKLHEFGCPVEVCPWCDGQVTNCNCRFDKLGLDEIVDEEQLAGFLELLSDKGRIPYKKEQSVSYPADSRGVNSD